MTTKLKTSDRLKEWIDSKQAHKIILVVILINALSISLQTSTTLKQDFGGVLEWFEDLTIFLFIVEIGIRAWAQGSRFLKGGWNIFDLVVVGLSLVPHEAGFSVLRSFRVLKSLSMFETNLHVAHIVNVILEVWPRVFVALFLMALSFFILGVMGVELYGVDFPQYFGDLGWSMFTLFMLMQSDGYGDISKEVIEVFPLAWIYFVSVTVLMAFVMMNLFVGIVVDAMQGFVQKETDEKLEKTEGLEEDEGSQLASLQKELKEIKKSLKDIRSTLKKPS